ncbi:MAG: tRNA (cytidine(34)-2'-O)-methyltransferase [Alphaproteobacteria bacterium]|nr:tRNA (cytidine(34)-2'-O)-methyltransferase [Alphaproteobacteria bacterium]
MQLALFEPEIAENAGAATRAAACFGAGLHLIEPCGFPLGSKRFARVALDYGLIAPPTIHTDWTAFLAATTGAGRRVLLTTRADATLWEADLWQTDIVILGRESAGAPSQVHEAVDLRIRIPLAPAARSLNVAMAGVITLAEYARRRLL